MCIRDRIYDVSLGGGKPRALTSMPGGATSPTLLANGSVVFVSPARGPEDGWFPKNPAALWALAPGEATPKRLTYGTASAADPTVLSDGRILFVSAMPPESSPPRCSLFTVYNDGTGVSPYACQHDGSGEIGRPRELPGGRIAFLSRATRSGRGGVPEMVLASRPWLSRQALLPADSGIAEPVSYTHLRAHETRHDLVCRLLLEKKKIQTANSRMYTKDKVYAKNEMIAYQKK